MESNYSVIYHDFIILLTTNRVKWSETWTKKSRTALRSTPYLPTEYGIPTECEICWVLLVTYGVVPIINIQIGKLESTCLTMQPCESRIAGTRVAVDTVGASSTILTRCAGAFVYIWNRLKTNVACKASNISRLTNIILLYSLHWSTWSAVSLIGGWCLIERNYLESVRLKLIIRTFFVQTCSSARSERLSKLCYWAVFTRGHLWKFQTVAYMFQ